jgi:hypothetical protein
MNKANVDKTRTKSNAFCFIHSVTVRKPVADVFGYLMKDVAARSMVLEKDREEFEQIGAGKAVEGSVTRGQEAVGDKEAPDRIEVIQLVRNKLIHVSFCPGEQGPAFVRDISGYYDLENVGRGETLLTLTQIVQMSNPLMKLLGTIVGAKRLMASQVTDELNTLKSEIEKNAHAS